MALFDFLNKRARERNEGGEMSFIDHLEELRWHLIRSALAIVIGAILMFVFAGFVVNDIIMAPTRPDFVTAVWLCNMGQKIGIGDMLCMGEASAKFISTKMLGQLVSTFTIGFIGGIIIAFPYIVWEFWKFVKPALSDKELRVARGSIFWVSILFFMGVAFGYFILTPFMVNFYFNYKLSDQITIFPEFSDYLENMIYTTVGVGVLFQLPLFIMVLTKVGIVSAKFLRKYRRHAFVAILIIAAIITPTTDPVSLGIVTIPLYLLFESSIMLAGKIDKAKGEQEEEWS